MSSAPKGRAIIEVLLDSNQLNKQLIAVEDNFKRVGANIARIGGGLTAFGGGLVASLLVAANEAGNAAEVFSRFEAVFQGASKEVADFAREVSKSIGRTESEVLDALSSYQSFFIGLGKTNDEAKELSKTLTTLALDFASFNNLADSDAQARFIAGLSGSSEVFDKFGVNIKAAALDQKFLQQGLNVTTATATETQKVMARLAIIIESLGRQGAIGDATRTADSYNNVLKRLKASFTELKTVIGSAIIQDIAQFNAKISESVAKVTEFIKANPGLVSSVLKIGSALVVAGGAITAFGFSLIGIGASFSTLVGAVNLAISAFASLGVVGSAAIIAINSPLSIALALTFAILANTTNLIQSIGELGASIESDLGGAFADAKNNFDSLKQAVLAGDLKLAFQILSISIKSFFLKAFNSILGAYDEWVALTISGINNVKISFQQAVLFIQQTFLRLGSVFFQVGDALGSAFLKVVPRIQNLFVRLTTRIRLLWLDIKGLVEAGINFSQGDISGAKEVLQNVLNEREKIKQEAQETIKTNLEFNFGEIESDISKKLKNDINAIKTEIDRLQEDKLNFAVAAFQGADEERAIREARIAELGQELKFLGLVAKQQSRNIQEAGQAQVQAGQELKKSFKSIVPRFGELAEAGSSQAIKLFGSSNNPLVKEQQQTNKKLDQLIVNTNGIEVR